jgi:hypothetical protein
MRITVDPTLDIHTLEWLPRPSYEIPDSEVLIRFDRSAQKQAGRNVNTANTVAGKAGFDASQVGSSFIPGLENQAQNPTGFTPVQKNRQLVAGAEAIGGVNSGLRGEANLASSRTRNAGGFAPALDEAARIKSRQLGTNALNVENEDARLAQEKQQFAQKQLQGLYGLDTTNQLRAMGLSDEAIAEKLKAGQQGWLQNTEGIIDTLTGAAKAAFPKGAQG